MKIDPDTPLLAGRPIVQAHSPEKSYMPQEYINCSVCFTMLEDKTFLQKVSPVIIISRGCILVRKRVFAVIGISGCNASQS